VKNPDPGAKIILTDMIKINECFYHFKHLYNDLLRKYEKAGSAAATNKILKDGLGVKTEAPSSNNTELHEEIKRLKLLVQQRDNEMMILLDWINKNKNNGQQLLVPVEGDKSMIISTSRDDPHKPITFPQFQAAIERETEKENSINSFFKY